MASIFVMTGNQKGDYITIGGTGLLFTVKDFADRESALSHFKKVGERERPTQVSREEQKE